VFVALWVWAHGTSVSASTAGVNFYSGDSLDAVNSWGHNWTVTHEHNVTIYYWYTHWIPGVGSQSSDIYTYLTNAPSGTVIATNGSMTSFWNPLSPGNYTVGAQTTVVADGVDDTGGTAINVTK